MSHQPEAGFTNDTYMVRMRSGSTRSSDADRERHPSLDGEQRPASDDVTNTSLLEFAACQFDVRRFDDVIDDISDVNDANDDGRNALHEMLEKYVTLDRMERAKVKGQMLVILSRLCERGLDVSAPVRSAKGPTSPNFRYAALHVVAKCIDCGDVIRTLIASGANVNMAEGHGRSALHLAVEGALLNNVKALLDGGADVSIKDEYGHTALHYAVKGEMVMSYG